VPPTVDLVANVVARSVGGPAGPYVRHADTLVRTGLRNGVFPRHQTSDESVQLGQTFVSSLALSVYSFGWAHSAVRERRLLLPEPAALTAANRMDWRRKHPDVIAVCRRTGARVSQSASRRQLTPDKNRLVPLSRGWHCHNEIAVSEPTATIVVTSNRN
jgi:hypothetical protein